MKEIFKKEINSIISTNLNYGVTVYALLKVESEIKIKKMILSENNDLSNKIKEWITSDLKIKYMEDEVEFENIDNLSDNKKSIYVLEKMKFNPFNFLNDINSLQIFSENEIDNLQGYLFKFNLNNNKFYVYQHIFVGNKIKGKTVLRLINKGEDKFDLIKEDTLRIDKRADMVILEDYIYVKNINVLQNYFKFDEYLKSESLNVIDKIKNKDFIDGIDRVELISSDLISTRQKKLLKIKESPVFDLEPHEIITKINLIPRYKEIIKVEGERIKINSKKDVNNLIKLLNDDFLKSDLTTKEYDSSSKKLLEDL